MTSRLVLPMLLAALMGGCAELEKMGGPDYGTTSGIAEVERNGTIASLETVQVDPNYKLGVGTAAGAVAGGIIGAKMGDSTTATVAGALLGGVAGTYAESKLGKANAQRVTVRMNTGGTVTILQPVDTRLRDGMSVRIEGSGESARVVPR